MEGVEYKVQQQKVGCCVNKREAEQNWWSALSDWLGRHQGRPDFRPSLIFIYHNSCLQDLFFIKKNAIFVN